MASGKKKSDTRTPHFESTLMQLESLIDTLEQNDTSLEDSLSAFKCGITLTRDAQKALALAEQEVLTLVEENSELVTQEFHNDDIEE